MIRHFEIPRIEGLPPKKDGSKSFWHKWNQKEKVEIDRLITLRRTVYGRLNGQKPLTKDIRLRVCVHTGRYGLEEAGDLDNSLGGICDGLTSHCCDTIHCNPWNDASYADIHPRKALAVANDKAIVSIDAMSIASEGEPWYSIELHGF